MKLALALLALSGCDAVFGLRDVGSRDDASSPVADVLFDDAMQPGGTPWSCAQPPAIQTWTMSGFSLVDAPAELAHPTVDAAHLLLYFAANADIYQCSVESDLIHANGCAAVSSLSGPSPESAPSLAPDNATLYLDRDGVAFQATEGTAGMWVDTAPLQLPGGLEQTEVGTPSSTTAHGVRMVVSDGNDLSEASYSAATGWIEIQASLLLVNSPNAHEVDPYLSPDGCWLLFASDRGVGNFDLWMALRNTNGGFDLPVPLPLLSSAGDDRSPSVANGQILYYVRDRQNIFVAQAP